MRSHLINCENVLIHPDDLLRTVIKVLDKEIIKLLIAECLFDKNLDPDIKE